MGELEENMQFQEASKNTRMTLLDQRAQTDMEKQRIMHALTNKRDAREKCRKRVETVREYSRNATNSSSTSDELLSYLQRMQTEIAEYFHRDREKDKEYEKKTQDAYGTFKVESERDENFLTDMEVRTRELVANASADARRPDRAKHMQAILQDLINLQRSWNSLLEDRWLKEDLECDCFWKGAKKPTKLGVSRFGSATPAPRMTAQQPALGWFPQLQDGNA